MYVTEGVNMEVVAKGVEIETPDGTAFIPWVDIPTVAGHLTGIVRAHEIGKLTMDSLHRGTHCSGCGGFKDLHVPGCNYEERGV